jgi:hypothetical protein
MSETKRSFYLKKQLKTTINLNYSLEFSKMIIWSQESSVTISMKSGRSTFFISSFWKENTFKMMQKVGKGKLDL